jgi:hypothetical protein
MPEEEIYCSKTTTNVRVYTTDASDVTSWTTYPTAVAFARPWRLIKPPATSSPSSTATASASDTEEEEGGRLTTGEEVGLGVGMAVFGIISLILALVWWRRIRRRRKNADDTKHHGLRGVAEAGGEPTVELPAKSAIPELDPTRQFNELDTRQRHELDDRGIGATVQICRI